MAQVENYLGWNSVTLTSCASGTAKVWLGFTPLHSLAKHYQPLNRALCFNGNFNQGENFETRKTRHM